MKKHIFTPLMAIVSLVVLVLTIAWLGLYFNEKGPRVLGQTNGDALKLILETPRPVVQQTFTVSVVANALGNKINAAGVYLRYDPQILQLMNMDTKSSFCQYYPEKKFDNNLGTVSLACGSPHPGVTDTNTLMTLEFLPLSVGNTKLVMDSRSQIMKSDGKGTNILKEFPTLEIPIFTGL